MSINHKPGCIFAKLLTKHPQRLQLLDKHFEPHLSSSQIQQRVAEIRLRLENDYRGRAPVFLSVLNGAFFFTADLLRGLPLDCELSFLKVASYQGTRSSGAVKEWMGLDISLEGRDVLLVEDIIDSGRTLEHLLPGLAAQEPASLEVVALLVKPGGRGHSLRPRYIGFEVEDRFLVGYGLDYNQKGRQLTDLYVLT